MTLRTIAMAVAQARTLLQDVQGMPAYRYLDQDLLDAFNDAMVEARGKRPDLFLDYGLRTSLPLYTPADLTGSTPFPIDEQVFSAFVYYIVGRCEMREDTFADNSRAVALSNKFVSQLLAVAS